jgi:ubiquinone/menaquinone biosynthesis C-methylase UbiE
MSPRAESLLAGQYFLAVHGLSIVRTLFVDEAAAQASTEAMRAIAADFDEFPHSLSIPLRELDVEAGYTQWSARYDGPNPAIEGEEPVVHKMLTDLPVGTALDAACGTGRHAAKLVQLGHEVIGVDRTEAMLDIARAKVPEADFRRGRLEDLPLDDESVDLVTCALALTHVPDLEPVLREFRRVLRPDGTVVLSDIHPLNTILGGGLAGFPDEDITKGIPYVLNRTHPIAAYIAAFRAAALTIADCVEPTIGEGQLRALPSNAFYPDATRRAFEGLPYLLIWQLRRTP